MSGTVDYEGGSAQIRRDALNDPLELDLASDVGAPWLGNYIAESSVVSAQALMACCPPAAKGKT